MRSMKGAGTSGIKSGKNQISEGGEEQGAADSMAPGDVLYTRLPSGSWWPAQVVDDKIVDGSVKPGNHSTGDVLVRLYGSYTYLYVDPIRSRSEFEMMLKHNNGDLRKILEEALEKDLPSTKSRRSKESSSKAKGTSSKRSTSKKVSNRQDGEQEQKNKVKRQKQNKVLNDGSQSHETASGKSQELSARRIRVMESLGLIAPPGSPFVRKGHNYNKTS